MANSFVYFTGNGSTTNFNFGFDYIDESYVKVYVDSNLLPDGSYTYTISSSTATISPAPASGLEVYIKRETPTSPLVDFVDGAVLTEADLDLIVKQALHVSVEAGDAAAVGLQLDGTETFWDANNKIIRNLSAAVNSTDAVTKGYVDSEMLHKNSGTNYDAQSLKVVNLADPAYDSDASTKKYVDESVTNLSLYATVNPTPVTLTGDGTTKTWQVSGVTHDYAYALLVTIDGVTQQHGTNYTLASGSPFSDITFSSAPPNNSNIAITNFGVRKNVPEISDTTVVATGSTTARSLEDRFNEPGANVKDWGAVGDGVTDDSTAIQNAMNSGAGTIIFPEGVYLITTQLNLTLTKDTKIRGANAVIKCGATSIINKMINITTATNNFSVDGITVDANNKARECLRITETAQDSCNLTLRDCVFKNAKTDNTTAAAGVAALGGFKKAYVNNCIFESVTKTLGSTASTTGCGFELSSSVYPRFVSVTGSKFESITNSETSGTAENVDADGLKVFGGNTAGSTYISSSAVISGNTFRNCKGRSVKIQNDQTTVIGNSFFRDILPITGGFSEVNLQIGSGEVSSNKFHYDEVSGVSSPFSDDGSVTSGSTVIGFYNGTVDARVGMVTVCNNTIYNNVASGVGVLENVAGLTTGGNSTKDRVYTVDGNKATGKLNYFLSMSPQTGTAKEIIFASNNYVEELATAFIGANSSGDYAKNIVNLNSCANGGTEVPAAWYASGSQVPAADYSVINCIGITPEAYVGKTTGRTFPTRISSIGAADGSLGGNISIQSMTLDDDAEGVFETRGYAGHSVIRLISCNYDNVTSGVFSDSTTGLLDLTGGASTGIAYGTTSNPDTDTKVNLWRDTTNNSVAIKNRLGSARVFTLVTIG